VVEYSADRVELISPLLFLEDLTDVQCDRTAGKLLDERKEGIGNSPFLDLAGVDRDETIDVQVLS
jgi:hypothetical protein